MIIEENVIDIHEDVYSTRVFTVETIEEFQQALQNSVVPVPMVDTLGSGPLQEAWAKLGNRQTASLGWSEFRRVGE